jgi:TonB family protein
MLKNILSLFLSVVLLQTAKAENPDTSLFYLKNSGQEVTIKDSADFYRIILPPDTNIDKDLYRVCDYYLNGMRKCVATSLTKDANLVLDGTCINYFENGKRKSTAQFKNGRYVGSLTKYYPNGNLYDIFKIEDLNSYYNRFYNGNLPDPRYGYKLQVMELRDSTGNLLTVNGTGHVVIFDEDFKKVVEEGNLSNNKKEGEWRGAIADSGKFICTFHRDVLKSGISFMKSGNHYSFKQIETAAVFSDGMDAFPIFIRKNLQYPESAKKHNVAGMVIVGFYIETNGTLSDVKIAKGLFKSLDDEALRVVSLSPLWIPASKFGIPIRSYYTVPVNFYKL